jgi:RNA recognition motif-containing protein
MLVLINRPAISESMDKNTLFIKNLPSGTMVADIRALSKDIREVRYRVKNRNRKSQKGTTGYVAFTITVVVL